MAYIVEQNGDRVVDAILTPQGRAKLALGQKLDISYFSLSDDQIDYTLYNSASAGGSDYYDNAIVNLPILEPVFNELQPIKYNLFSTDTTGAKPIISIAATAGFNGGVITVPKTKPPRTITVSCANAPVGSSEYFFIGILENTVYNSRTVISVATDASSGPYFSEQSVKTDYQNALDLASQYNAEHPGKKMFVFKSRFDLTSLIPNPSYSSITTLTIYPSALIGTAAPISVTVCATTV
jgi:hypothetical protein